MDSVIGELASLMSEKNMEAVFTTPRITSPVNADAVRLAQVFRNLLSNAIKFSRPGGRLEIACETRPDEVLWSVRDEGPGIPNEELEQIFEKFQQSSRTRTGAGGTGLGLAICREIVNAHQGKIWATNHPDGGACFHVELPAAKIVKRDAARTSPRPGKRPTA